MLNIKTYDIPKGGLATLEALQNIFFKNISILQIIYFYILHFHHGFVENKTSERYVSRYK